jgi:hypothetical protein
MNETMRTEEYDEKKFWHSLFGKSVDRLWQEYKDTWSISPVDAVELRRPYQAEQHLEGITRGAAKLELEVEDKKFKEFFG